MIDADVTLLRFDSNPTFSNGMLYVKKDFEVFTIEDKGREVKKAGETRILDGRVKIALRPEGGFHNNYKKKFNEKTSRDFMGLDWHKGMLCIYNEPNWKLVYPNMSFQYVLIHIGNTSKNTDACELVGLTSEVNKDFIGKSTDAYKIVYPRIRDLILKSECGWIEMDIKTIGQNEK